VLKPVSNPPNPWATTEVEYFEDLPPARLEIYEDHTREILAHNDSPDVGFSWSLCVLPFRRHADPHGRRHDAATPAPARR